MDKNPIDHTLVYHATRVGVDVGLGEIGGKIGGKVGRAVGAGVGVYADYDSFPHKAAEFVDKPFKGVSDQAWEMMQFYEQHGLHEEAMDHGLQMRHAGCEVY
jgi:hypothetical protein